MSNSNIKSLKFTIDHETLIVFSDKRICKGFYLSHKLVKYFELIVDIEIKIIETIKDYVLLKREDLINIAEGDILLFRPNGTIRKIYNSQSEDNVIFVTEQCNNHCLMCSQPPRKTNDIDYFFNLNMKLIDLLPDNVTRLGISGGEPTLLEEKLIFILEKIKRKLPNTAIQLLSNGKNFDDIRYVKQISDIGLKDFIIGIPFHSDFYKDHDLISQSQDSYNKTLKGLYNLARFNLNIELRVVINKINYSRLFEISNYIFHNFPFVSHVAFMGMEYTGLVPKNNKEIWIDQTEYNTQLKSAVLNLATWGMNVSVFNLPLCLVDKDIHPYVRKSISDWKVEYFEQCDNCSLKNDCGGDFGTSLKHSVNILPLS